MFHKQGHPIKTVVSPAVMDAVNDRDIASTPLKTIDGNRSLEQVAAEVDAYVSGLEGASLILDLQLPCDLLCFRRIPRLATNWHGLQVTQQCSFLTCTSSIRKYVYNQAEQFTNLPVHALTMMLTVLTELNYTNIRGLRMARHHCCVLCSEAGDYKCSTSSFHSGTCSSCVIPTRRSQIPRQLCSISGTSVPPFEWGRRDPCLPGRSHLRPDLSP
jgi:hypothetical protein